MRYMSDIMQHWILKRFVFFPLSALRFYQMPMGYNPYAYGYNMPYMHYQGQGQAGYPGGPPAQQPYPYPQQPPQQQPFYPQQ